MTEDPIQAPVKRVLLRQGEILLQPIGQRAVVEPWPMEMGVPDTVPKAGRRGRAAETSAGTSAAKFWPGGLAAALRWQPARSRQSGSFALPVRGAVPRMRPGGLWIERSAGAWHVAVINKITYGKNDAP